MPFLPPPYRSEWGVRRALDKLIFPWGKRVDYRNCQIPHHAPLIPNWRRWGMIIINRCIIIITVRDIAILQKYIDIFAGTFGFWLLGYAISGNTNEPVLGEEQDYIF